MPSHAIWKLVKKSKTSSSTNSRQIHLKSKISSPTKKKFLSLQKWSKPWTILLLKKLPFSKWRKHKFKPKKLLFSNNITKNLRSNSKIFPTMKRKKKRKKQSQSNLKAKKVPEWMISWQCLNRLRNQPLMNSIRKRTKSHSRSLNLFMMNWLLTWSLTAKPDLTSVVRRKSESTQLSLKHFCKKCKKVTLKRLQSTFTILWKKTRILSVRA